MSGEARRTKLITLLKNAEAPITASKIANDMGVTRQVIVHDVALLRAAGYPVASLSNGYMLIKQNENGFKRAFKCKHSDEDVEKELNIIVDAGGKMDDVFVYHKVYGKVRADMNIKSRLDAKKFIEKIKNGKSSLLKNVTSGYHYHTVSADSIETLDLIESELKKAGFLAPLQEYEPEEINRK